MTKQSPAFGVLVVNLGTPDHPDTASVRKYLRQFLWDPRVIDYPRWLWALILNGIILPIRAPRVAKLYQKIWLANGSPLRVYSQNLANALEVELGKVSGQHVVVEMAMTYGSPNLQQGLDKLMAQGVDRIIVLPIYPQYSATTTAATFDALNRVLQNVRNLPELRFIKHYAEQDSYIEALADSIRRHRAKAAHQPDLLLFSFHGLPKRYITLGDPYQKECQQTAERVTAVLGLTREQWEISYQSRVGKEEWLKPYTSQRLEQLAAKGIHAIDVICPAFATDCLETLEEIAIENRDVFINAGGKSYHYIPALNDDPKHIAALAELVMQHRFLPPNPMC